MAIDDKVSNEKLQYDINRETEKISALSSGKIDRYEYLTGEEILTPGQKRTIEQAKITYSPLGKAFEKQIKTIEDQGEKHIKGLEEHGKQLVKYSNKKESSTIQNKKKFRKNRRMEEWKKWKNE